ncbi:MAG: TonB-dependent receptor [Verrucomicrobiota bacterium]|nr:TonB-dependent receptor [Verrucomicrobiota bacterium]
MKSLQASLTALFLVAASILNAQESVPKDNPSPPADTVLTPEKKAGEDSANRNKSPHGFFPDEDVINMEGVTILADKAGYMRNEVTDTVQSIPVMLRKVPFAVGIISEEQMRGMGINEAIDSFRLMAGISTQPDDVLNPSAGLKIRGFSAGRFLRNGYVKYYLQNLDGIDKIEVVRGPLAALYGQSEPGGVVNFITKKPSLTNWQQSVRFAVGSDAFYKAYIDSTGPILKDKLGYRVISTYQNSGSWKDFVSNERQYLLTALRYKPLKNLQIDLDYEYNLNRQRGAIRTGLVEHADYLADYSRWQEIGERLKFSQLLSAKNEVYTTKDSPLLGTRKGTYSPYNLNFFTRYPMAYSDASLLGKRPWMGVGFVDPRTGKPQQPIIERDPGFGVVFQGELQNRDFIQSTANLYRHGWRTLSMLEKIGAYNPQTGAFTKVDLKSLDPATVNAGPVLTNLAFPLGESFNPNGPGAWYFDESHVATAELKYDVTDWLSVKYGSNYYENWSKQVQQYNSDTDMDGYTLDAGQGFPKSPGTTSGATGMGFFNRRWVHQLSVNLHGVTGPLTHDLSFNTEYRDDYFMQYNPLRSDTWATVGGKYSTSVNPQGSPGFAIWDIYNDPAPKTNEWASDNWVFNNTSHATVQTGYGTSYRMSLWDEKLQFWSGIRHERQEQFGLDKDGIRTTAKPVVTGTTPMVGVSYEVGKQVNLYASYSESFISRNPDQNNKEYYNPYKIKNPALAAYLADSDNNPAPQSVSVEDFTYEPLQPLTNPKGIGYETGIKCDVGDEATGFLSGTASLFHLERQGLINQLSGSTDDMNAEIARINRLFPALKLKDAAPLYANSGKEVTEGVELNLTYLPNQSWQFTASCSYLFTKKATAFDDRILYGNKNVPPGTTHPANGDGPIPNASLYYFDPNSETYLAKWPSNNNGKQDVGEQRDPTVSDTQRLIDDPTYYDEVYLPKYTSELNNVPDLQLNLSARYDVRDGYLKGAHAVLSYTYEGSSPVAVNGQTNGTYVLTPFRNPETHLFDGSIGYKFPLGKNTLDVSLSVRNILDGRFTKGSFGVMDPRTYRIDVEYKF